MNCTWGVLVAEGSVIRYGKDADLNSISEKLLKVNNLAIEGKPDDLVINTHVCRGNYHSAYFSSGAYDPVAEKLFGEENVNAHRDRKSTRLNSSHVNRSRMPSSA